jgi:hypothetical protein
VTLVRESAKGRVGWVGAVEESPLLEAIVREQLVKTHQAEKG